MASAKGKRPGRVARELSDPPEEFSRALGSMSDAEAGPWRLCPSKGCRKAGRCRGGADECPEDIENQVIWLREALRAGCAGLSPRAAVRIADRHVLALRNDLNFARRAGKRR
jgi:hypothetical protein